jgi:hypothetical protein
MRESHLATLLKDNRIQDNCVVPGDGDSADLWMRSTPWSGFRVGCDRNIRPSGSPFQFVSFAQPCLVELLFAGSEIGVASSGTRFLMPWNNRSGIVFDVRGSILAVPLKIFSR